jgi:hypothetical protein
MHIHPPRSEDAVLTRSSFHARHDWVGHGGVQRQKPDSTDDVEQHHNHDDDNDHDIDATGQHAARHRFDPGLSRTGGIPDRHADRCRRARRGDTGCQPALRLDDEPRDDHRQRDAGDASTRSAAAAAEPAERRRDAYGDGGFAERTDEHRQPNADVSIARFLQRSARSRESVSRRLHQSIRRARFRRPQFLGALCRQTRRTRQRRAEPPATCNFVSQVRATGKTELANGVCSLDVFFDTDRWMLCDSSFGGTSTTLPLAGVAAGVKPQ